MVTALRCAFALNQQLYRGLQSRGGTGRAQTADAHNSRPRFLLSGRRKKTHKKKNTPRSAGDQLSTRGMPLVMPLQLAHLAAKSLLSAAWWVSWQRRLRSGGGAKCTTCLSVSTERWFCTAEIFHPPS